MLFTLSMNVYDGEGLPSLSLIPVSKSLHLVAHLHFSYLGYQSIHIFLTDCHFYILLVLLFVSLLFLFASDPTLYETA